MDPEFSPKFFHEVLTIVPLFLFSLCVHEYAHAWLATRLGDTSARQLGRLSMDPTVHVDPVGTILFPALCLFFHWAFFGWAKPVKVSSADLKFQRRGMALVALAGPFANFVMALVLTGVLAWIVRVPVEHSIVATIHELVGLGIKLNLMLGFFNLIPLPPLDGYTVLQALVPLRWLGRLQIADRNADFILLLLLTLGGLNLVARPVSECHFWLLQLAGA